MVKKYHLYSLLGVDCFNLFYLCVSIWVIYLILISLYSHFLCFQFTPKNNYFLYIEYVALTLLNCLMSFFCLLRLIDRIKQYIFCLINEDSHVE